MADSDTTPVVLGLYRHDLPEAETLRTLLEWLRHRSVLADPIRSQTSADQAHELLLRIQLMLAISETPTHELSPENVLERMIRLSQALPEPPRIDESLIAQALAANDSFPFRIRLRALELPWCPISVGYADALPDDARGTGRRLVEIAATPADWREYPVVPPGGQPLGPHLEPWQRPAALADELEKLLYELALHVAFDYAAIRQGRDLPGPLTLQTSADPEDLDRLFISLPAAQIDQWVREFADIRDCRVAAMRNPRPFDLPYATGISIRLPDPAEPLSQRAQAVLARLRAHFADRFR